MNTSDLFNAVQQPPVYTAGTASIWTDPYISSRLLDIHLSQETDLASRKTPAIEQTLDFILNQVTDRPLRILDLGCGPGLYAERLTALGHQVTGMDISSTSIAHARKSARNQGLDLTYICRDYLCQAPLCLDHVAGYDLIMMIFTDFGVLYPAQRAALLDRVYRALKPGGVFIFDVLNTAWRPSPAAVKTWDLAAEGFWRPGPCLVLSQIFEYEPRALGQNLFLSQHTVTDEAKGLDIYRFYTHTFSHAALTDILTARGFKGICSALRAFFRTASCTPPVRSASVGLKNNLLPGATAPGITPSL